MLQCSYGALVCIIWSPHASNDAGISHKKSVVVLAGWWWLDNSYSGGEVGKLVVGTCSGHGSGVSLV